ncbi:MAG: hypothetical protein ACOCU6_03525, partial [Nanoarchaeota archaeon]
QIWVQIPVSPLFFSFFLAPFRDLNMLDTSRIGTLSTSFDGIPVSPLFLSTFLSLCGELVRNV